MTAASCTLESQKKKKRKAMREIVMTAVAALKAEQKKGTGDFPYQKKILSLAPATLAEFMASIRHLVARNHQL